MLSVVHFCIISSINQQNSPLFSKCSYYFIKKIYEGNYFIICVKVNRTHLSAGVLVLAAGVEEWDLQAGLGWGL